MDLTISVAYPAGNTTVLVETPVKQEEYAEVSKKLLALPHLHAEQVGFLVPPQKGGDVRLEMMGGEFCGNALRSAALWYLCAKGLSGKQTVQAEISGSDTPLSVTYDPQNGEVTAEMPLPEKISACELHGASAAAVCFEGIVHLILDRPDDWMTLEEIRAVLRESALHFHKQAAGLLLYHPETDTMHPAVYVAETDTLTCENSCASGTAAISAFVAANQPDGTYSLMLHQPGGTLHTETTVCNGKLTALSLSGIVTLTDAILAKV